MAKANKQQVKEARELLQKNVQKDDTIFFVVKRVSNSGMYRHIDFYKFDVKDTFEEGENRVRKVWLSSAIAKVLGYSFKEQTQSVGVQGCGMDMGFSVIYNLAHNLFDDGYALKHEQL